eukprot:4667478-Prymnesium_polylepis.1
MLQLTSRCVACSGLSHRIELALLRLPECSGLPQDDIGNAGVQYDQGSDGSDGSGTGGGSCVGDGSDDEGQQDAALLQTPLPAELCGPPADLLLLDPCFSPLRRMWSGVHLCELVRQRRWAEARGLATESTPQLPCSVRLFGALLQCPDLWRRHQVCTDAPTRRQPSVASPMVEHEHPVAPCVPLLPRSPWPRCRAWT